MTSEYERQRAQRLMKNHEHMVGLGLVDLASSLEPAPKVEERVKKIKKAPAPLIKERPRRNVPVVSFKPVPRVPKPKPAELTDLERALIESTRRRSNRLGARPAINFAEFPAENEPSSDGEEDEEDDDGNGDDKQQV
ncbi:hypothetical protein BASA81_000935 [Batrachochytrium salamandrivorans]|nr:hypothetical protein BASA81_000935 [Batrachochytrium salamandrivorans]